jgi:hypothetical protein
MWRFTPTPHASSLRGADAILMKFFLNFQSVYLTNSCTHLFLTCCKMYSFSFAFHRGMKSCKGCGGRVSRLTYLDIGGNICP